MKKTSIIKSFIFIISILCLNSVQVRADQSIYLSDELFIESHGVAFVENHNNALTIFHNFHNSLQQTRAGQLIYPNYFGGMYINTEGNLVALVVDSAAFQSGHQSTLLQLQSAYSIELQYAYHPYNYLRSIMTTIDFFIDTTPHLPIAKTTRVWHIDVRNNRIIVELEDYTFDMIESFRENISASTAIHFEPFIGYASLFYNLPISESANFEYNIDYTTEQGATIQPLSNRVVRPGESIFIRRQSFNNNDWMGQGSVGMPARHQITGVLGFITSAHLGIGVTGVPLQPGDTVWVNEGATRVQVGIVDSVSFQGYDGAFIRLVNGATASYQLANGQTLSQGIFIGVAEGQVLAWLGGSTNVLQMGTATPGVSLNIPLGNGSFLNLRSGFLMNGRVVLSNAAMIFGSLNLR